MTHQYEIPDEVVEAALVAWFGNSFVRITECDEEYRKEMQAALQAALSMLLGEPVAYFEPETFNACNHELFHEVKELFPDTYNDWFPLYALKEQQS